MNFPIQISGVRSFCLIFLFGRFKWINWVLGVVHKWFKIILTHSPIIRDYILVSQHKHTWPSSEAVTSFVILIPSKYKSNWLISFFVTDLVTRSTAWIFPKTSNHSFTKRMRKKKNLEKLNFFWRKNVDKQKLSSKWWFLPRIFVFECNISSIVKLVFLLLKRIFQFIAISVLMVYNQRNSITLGPPILFTLHLIFLKNLVAMCYFQLKVQIEENGGP